MKKNKQYGKKLAVILVIGLALLYNADIYNTKVFEYSNNSSLEKNNVVNAKENKNSELAVYVKTIIVTGISQIFSNH